MLVPVLQGVVLWWFRSLIRSWPFWSWAFLISTKEKACKLFVAFQTSLSGEPLFFPPNHRELVKIHPYWHITSSPLIWIGLLRTKERCLHVSSVERCFEFLVGCGHFADVSGSGGREASEFELGESRTDQGSARQISTWSFPVLPHSRSPGGRIRTTCRETTENKI
jgi:hypothetical protein